MTKKPMKPRKFVGIFGFVGVFGFFRHALPKKLKIL